MQTGSSEHSSRSANLNGMLPVAASPCTHSTQQHDTLPKEWWGLWMFGMVEQGFRPALLACCGHTCLRTAPDIRSTHRLYSRQLALGMLPCHHQILGPTHSQHGSTVGLQQRLEVW